MFNRYFQQELANLKDLGGEFAKAHPALAPMLSGSSADPDVERLLEGVAFLTALPAAAQPAPEGFKALDTASLQDDSERYHRMARNLRNRYKLRAQKVSALQQQVQQTIAEAQQRQAEQLEAARQQQAQAQSSAASPWLPTNAAERAIQGTPPRGAPQLQAYTWNPWASQSRMPRAAAHAEPEGPPRRQAQRAPRATARKPRAS